MLHFIFPIPSSYSSQRNSFSHAGLYARIFFVDGTLLVVFEVLEADGSSAISSVGMSLRLFEAPNHFSSDMMNGVRRTLNSESAGLYSLRRAHGKVIALKSLSPRNCSGRTPLFEQSSVPLASVGSVSRQCLGFS